MSARGAPRDLAAAVAASLERLDQVSTPAAARMRAACGDASDHGPDAVAQHLRNLLLAHGSARSLAARPSIGLSRPDIPAVLAIAAALDHALGDALAPLARAGVDRAAPDRLLIVLDHLPAGGRIFSHTRQVCAYAAALSRAPEVERVGVLASRETAPENPFEAPEARASDPSDWVAELKSVDPDAAARIAFFAPPRLGPVHPYAASVSWARDFAAGIVIAAQGVFRSRVLPPVLAGQTAVIALQMNATNPEPDFADLVLAHGDGTSRAVRSTPGKWRDHPVPMLAFPPLTAHAAPGLDSPPLVVATVLTQGRLERGLLANGGADLDLVRAFLRDHPLAQWRMIGLEDPDAFAAALADRSSEVAALLGDRLSLLGVVADPSAYFTDGGLYVHPPALGGGAMGAAMAIQAGMAVLARAGGDIANLLPVGHAYRDASQARLWLERLAADPALRARWNLAQRRVLARDHSIAAAATALRPILAQARTIARSKAAPP